MEKNENTDRSALEIALNNAAVPHMEKIALLNYIRNDQGLRDFTEEEEIQASVAMAQLYGLMHFREKDRKRIAREAKKAAKKTSKQS